MPYRGFLGTGGGSSVDDVSVPFQHPTDGLVIGVYTLDQTTELPTGVTFYRADTLDPWTGTASELQAITGGSGGTDTLVIWPTAVTYTDGPGAATNTAGNYVSDGRPSIVQITGHPTGGAITLYKVEQDTGGNWKWERL